MDNETIQTPTREELRSPEVLAKYIVSILDAKKAKDIKLLHVEKRTVIADYFVICSGNSRTQLRSLADEVEFKLGEVGIHPAHIEGADTGVWVLEDFSSVILHVFNTESRKFYNLEKLYEDTTECDINSLITED